MIITEYFTTRPDGVNLYRTYSDEKFCLQCEQTNEIFDEVINVEGHKYTYIETNKKISPPTVEILDDVIEAVNILLGR